MEKNCNLAFFVFDANANARFSITVSDVSYLRTNDNISPPQMLFGTANFHPHFPKEEESWVNFFWDENMQIKIIF